MSYDKHFSGRLIERFEGQQLSQGAVGNIAKYFAI